MILKLLTLQDSVTGLKILFCRSICLILRISNILHKPNGEHGSKPNSVTQCLGALDDNNKFNTTYAYCSKVQLVFFFIH